MENFLIRILFHKDIGVYINPNENNSSKYFYSELTYSKVLIKGLNDLIGNVPLKHTWLVNAKILFSMSCRRSSFNQVNDWAQRMDKMAKNLLKLIVRLLVKMMAQSNMNVK